MHTAAGTLWSQLEQRHMENVWEHEVIVLTPVTSSTVRSVVFHPYELQSAEKISAVSL